MYITSVGNFFQFVYQLFTWTAFWSIAEIIPISYLCIVDFIGGLLICYDVIYKEKSNIIL